MDHTLPASWQTIRDLVHDSHDELTEEVLAAIEALFRIIERNGVESPAQLTREYERREFLQVVSADGHPSPVSALMLKRFQGLVDHSPAFHRWFRLDQIREGEAAGQPVLLAARWLCHLVGLRHITVEIFLDPPHLTGHTLVQVRGMEKAESPGAFDLPCAGHVEGVDSIEHSLAKELAEELNLSVADDLADLRLVGCYNAAPGLGQAGNEYRALYQARLKAESVARVRFLDGEVAGLCLFSVGELRALLDHYPERVASGLNWALPLYQE